MLARRGDLMESKKVAKYGPPARTELVRLQCTDSKRQKFKLSFFDA
jgi:hypothetical protein